MYRTEYFSMPHGTADEIAGNCISDEKNYFHLVTVM